MKPKLADGGIRQDSFDIVGSQRHDACQQRGEQPDHDHRGAPAWHACEGRVEAGQQVDACIDHRGGMDEGGHGRGRFHGIRQPGMQRHLRGFGGGCHQETKGHQAQDARRQGVRLGQEVADLVIAQIGVDQQRTCQQTDPAQLGHDQSLDAAGHRFRVVVMERDQRIRTKGGDLPEDEGEQQVARETQAGHGADEEQDQGVVAGQLFLVVHACS